MVQKHKILYCRCAYAKIIPEDVKDKVLKKLIDSGRSFKAVTDLCEMSAQKDPELKDLVEGKEIKIAACYPRAVKWLFSAAGFPISGKNVEILNMRVEKAENIVCQLLDSESEKKKS